MTPAGRRARFALGVGGAVLAGATAGLLAGAEPFATGYYSFAWYSTLLIVDAAVALRDGRFFFLGRPAFAATLLAWSVPFWLLFELFNFRIDNWYYVFVPADLELRWAGTALAFATVLPAILGFERLLDAWRVAREARIAPLRVSPALLVGLQLAGALMLLGAVAWPRGLFPLVWGGVALVVDPWVYRREPDRSLIGDLEAGRPGRAIRLLAGGLVIGGLWELFNIEARAKWIYTVPGFEEAKVFEMPVLGFLGFPPFALEGFAVWQALVVAGAAVPREGRTRPAPAGARAAVAAAALVLSLAVLAGIDRDTVSSTLPSLAGLPSVPEAALQRVGIEDPFELARTDPDELAAAARVEPEVARGWIATARLATLRGIGADHARALRRVGIPTVEVLARADPAELAADLAARGHPVPPARVRVWVRAARRAAR
ncbi:MAG: DUF4332 domain-containing protein [Gemmatimonadota bacterium]|nr:DUF4332 domain-containing protein [Gemmatimonadota bacterium]